jgi:hypothetical protein
VSFLVLLITCLQAILDRRNVGIAFPVSADDRRVLLPGVTIREELLPPVAPSVAPVEDALRQQRVFIGRVLGVRSRDLGMAELNRAIVLKLRPELAGKYENESAICAVADSLITEFEAVWQSANGLSQHQHKEQKPV